VRYLRALLSRITGIFAGPGADEAVREELEAHLEMEAAEHVRRGLPPEEARRRALLASGGLTQAAEAVRDRRGLPWLEHFAADVRFAIRSLRRSPGYTTVVVLTLALAIGANTAIYSVVRGVLLKALPNRGGDRLVYLRHSVDGPAGGNIGFSVPEVRDYRTGAPAFAGIAEYCPFYADLHEAEGTTRINIGLVTGNYFAVMGLAPILGRVTRPSDDGPGVPPVMMLTHHFWTAHFGGDPGVVGRRLQVNGTTATVIGVLQDAPSFPGKVDAWFNMMLSAHHLSATMVLNRSHRMTEVMARLATGATLAEARAQVAAVDARAQRDNPATYEPASHYRVAVIPFGQALGERAQLTLWLLMGAAAFVLVIAAANVTNLTLMRGVRRGHELVTRAALGAGVARLRRLLLAENLVLSLTSAAFGVLLAAGGVRLLIALAARYSPRADEIRLDGQVLAFALGLSLLLALVLAFAAALPREGAFASWIASGGPRTSAAAGRQRLQHGLVVAQVAVSVVLLAAAGLLTRTMIRLSDVDPGLTTENVLTFPLTLLDPNQMLSNPGADAAAKLTFEQIRARLGALPGIRDVGLGSTMPLTTSPLVLEIEADGVAPAAGQPTPMAEFRTADPQYFGAAGIPLLRGRVFSPTDAPGAGRVVVVNRTFVDRFYPHEDPIGRRIAMTGEVLKVSPFSGDWRTIVGVVGDTRDGGMDAPSTPVVFMPWAQEIAFFSGIVIRTAGDPAAVTAAATRIVRGLAPQSAIQDVMTVAQIKDQSVAPRRLNAELISLFGVLALVIAAVGIAGVLAFSVSARTNEIGIRMSLGADARQVQRMILREVGVLLAIGLVLGIAGALAGAGVLRGLLFGVVPHDPETYVGVTLLMAAIGLGACWIPALRAARIDPVVTMRA
jgi:putative ABC transport system permease protein